ncbi:MAG: PilN domain-containing protein, partial [Candidatus Binataceae bacterium]
RQTLLAHGSDLEPPELLIAGPAAAMPEVRAEIVQGLASAVRKAGDPGYSAPLEELQPDSAPFAACVAMLFGESPVEPLELLNFRQGDFAFQGRTGDIAPLYTSGILAAAIAFMVVLNLVLGIAISLHRVSVMNSQIEAIAGLVLGPRRAADAQGALRAGIADMEKQLTLMGGSVARGSALDAVQAISKAIPQRLAVEFSDLQIDRSGLKLSGTADSFGIIDNVKRSLTQGGFFGEIEVNDAKAGATGGKVEFTLSAAPSDNPAPGME